MKLKVPFSFDFVADFLFPNNTPPEDMAICDNEIKLFCKDYVERAEVMFILATVACLFVILSLVSIICLSLLTCKSVDPIVFSLISINLISDALFDVPVSKLCTHS